MNYIKEHFIPNFLENYIRIIKNITINQGFLNYFIIIYVI